MKKSLLQILWAFYVTVFFERDQFLILKDAKDVRFVITNIIISEVWLSL